MFTHANCNPTHNISPRCLLISSGEWPNPQYLEQQYLLRCPENEVHRTNPTTQSQKTSLQLLKLPLHKYLSKKKKKLTRTTKGNTLHGKLFQHHFPHRNNLKRVQVLKMKSISSVNSEENYIAAFYPRM